ncbi:MAG: alpha-amylase family glycosyl hydrolase [Sphingobacteriaceae bacterium]|nr:alpha-amylase family glycosyl hydrolase [Sphingobacteriaceae bacterium]
MKHSLYFLPLLGLLSCAQPQPEAVHPLDSWSEEIIYFALTDRFADGDSSNNDLGDKAYDPNQAHTFHGGDFAGMAQNIGYLKSLGVTTLWITPPVKNQTWSPDSSLTGYHGYWASHFAKTDPHLGSLQDYQALSKQLKSAGMRLIQDVVTNHTGDYFQYTGPYQADAPWVNYKRIGAPEQEPFQLNDPNQSAHRQAAIYHFTPNIVNYQDSVEKLRGQMSGLDDLNTSNRRVQDTLKASFRFWMEAVQLDGMRFDTPMYVEHAFWNKFLHDSSHTAPGLYPFARQQQRPDFYTFGETWVHSQPFDNSGEKVAASYLGTPEAPEMDGILNFPMQQSLMRVFGGGAPTSELSYRLAQEQAFFPQPWQKLHFIDNHDMPRFRSLTSSAATQQALAFILTIPGIPVLYYGTEQGITETRPNLFGQHDSLSADFKFLQQLIQLRKSHPAFSRGELRVLADDSLQAGLLLYELRYQNERKYVAFNTKDVAISAGSLPLGTETGRLKPVFQQGKATAGSLAQGQLSFLQLGPRAMVVYNFESETAEVKAASAKIELLSRPPVPITQTELLLSGTYAGLDSLVALLDGLEVLSMPIQFANGQFELQLHTENVPFGAHQLRLLGYQAGQLLVVAGFAIETALPQQSLFELLDPQGDDLGPQGKYSYPTAFGDLRSMDIAKLTAFKRGNELVLELEMHANFSTQWNPPLGFDHVQFFVFLNLNQGQGSRFYAPLQYVCDMDQGFTQLISLNGWQMSLQQVDTAGQLQTVAGSPELRILSPRKLSLRLSPELLGFPANLHNLQLRILSWDSAGEGALRPLAVQAGDYSFGGAKGQNAPMWMDQLQASWSFAARR